MLKYLKAAFTVKRGGVPINIIGTAAFVALGFVHPGFWAMGALLVGGFTIGLANTERFQKVVDGLELTKAAVTEDIEDHRKNIIRKLPKDEHLQFKQFKYTCDKIIRLYEDKETDDIVISDTRMSLDRLSWNYIKLLLARGRLNAKEWEGSIAEVDQQLDTLQAEMNTAYNLTDAIRQSKQTTIDTLGKRREILTRRDGSLEEITADLERLDSQLQLVLDRAGTQGTSAAIQSDFESGSILYNDLFGEDRSEIEATDHLYEQMMEAE